ncbi:MAG: hypothetical protein COA79_21735 [Planctomycetota bacterium]|nr:MAG: hypothetical protein COA79_21735 [Planctomycetota bacterium]
MSFNKEFLEAALYGELDKVKSFLSQDPSLINQADENGFTALHEVAGEEQFETIKYLIDNGADVNAINNDGTTPLHLAAYSEAIELLIINGANINAINKEGDTPLMISTLCQDAEELIETLLTSDADISVKNNKGQTALDMAKMRNEDEYISILEESSTANNHINNKTYTNAKEHINYVTQHQMAYKDKTQNPFGLLLLKFLVVIWFSGLLFMFALSTLTGYILFILTSPISVFLLIFCSNSIKVENERIGKTTNNKAKQYILLIMAVLVIVAVILMVNEF